MSGPLAGVRIIEMAGIGPGPFCGMMLADHGAEVIRVERPGAVVDRHDALARSRRSIVLDLKDADAIAQLRGLVATADGLIEGFRPGVMERLGLGPDVLLADNPKLVYGRMTGWGQTGPLAQAAGHDINYVALSGALHGCGRAGERPTPPMNLLGDFGGGAMMLAFAMASALFHVSRGGSGQVIDCAITDGSALLNAMTMSFVTAGEWRDERGVNLLDTGAHFYDSYECADGKYISIGAIEPKFYALLREKLGLEDDAAFDRQLDATAWPLLKTRLEALFRTRARDEWCALLEGTDACFAPVLSVAEAPGHPHNAARDTFIDVDGLMQPAPAPRFSVTRADRPRAARPVGADTVEILQSANVAG
ncbi:alpha-methylacyl-CoA racemase [Sphingobium sp. TA15]|uniref:Putative L-carnitine dehydratase n=1 Tax=Sphingobium indicum (strain DSM 16413 / CCM 7287 / MTCC 6362 / UT26 / NBRC 101211 / UT26S) TaxID=452662 RepID=D4Z8E2_SPHIU|nr:CaiB/BaiF CoA-transferase family protein [Sphingobium indicum]BAI98761.1 putative L-carnitine dehydratase [Sphingobium indicum UT26S]BDD68809.1 alpha-methylacyl-CoA racemase [Sphingobium sp. TA15]